MTRPPFEVADIIRQHGDRFIQTHGTWLTRHHRGVLRALGRCRTAALGGHLDRGERCDHRAISYNSCRNRHGPKCLTHARDQWLAARPQELLPVGYHHVVFTLPHDLSWLALQNKTVVYDLLCRASAATLLEVAVDPTHLGAAIGFLTVLHTWGQNLRHHPHVHGVIPVGGLSPNRAQWVRSRYPFFLPVKVLSRVFRGKCVAPVSNAPSDSASWHCQVAWRRWLMWRRAAPSCDNSFDMTGWCMPNHPLVGRCTSCTTSHAPPTASRSRIIELST